MMAKRPTASYVRSRLKYSANTGKLTWKTKPGNSSTINGWNTKYSGKQAGCAYGAGYLSISIDGIIYQATSVIWLIVTGKWPTKEIDHEDLNPSNNSWTNLRVASRGQNGSNRRKQKNNTSGYKGVHWCKRSKKWFARITVDRKIIYLGHFLNKLVAYNAYVKASKKYHKQFSNVG